MFRRIKDYSQMVSNSIGIIELSPLSAESVPLECSTSVRASPRGVDHLSYFWNTDKNGHPESVLTIPPFNKCLADQQRLWPIAGLSVVVDIKKEADGQGGAKLLLLADLVCLNGNSAESLQFEDYETVLILVHNPYDAPQRWRFDYKIFPDTGKVNYKW